MNTTYWMNKIMDTMYTSGDGAFYLGLSSTQPTLAGENVSEPIGGAYARVQVTEFSTPMNGMVKNVNRMSFPRSNGVWFPSTNKATHWVLFDGAGDDANVLTSGELDTPRTVEGNTVITIDANTLTITLTNPPASA